MIDDIIEEDTEEGVLLFPSIIGAAVEEAPPRYEGLLSKEPALALTPLFNYSIDEKVGLNDVEDGAIAAVGGFGANKELPPPILD